MKGRRAVEDLSPNIRLALLETLLFHYKRMHAHYIGPGLEGEPISYFAPKEHLAHDLDISPQYLSYLLSQKYCPSNDLTEKIIYFLSETYDFHHFVHASERTGSVLNPNTNRYVEGFAIYLWFFSEDEQPYLSLYVRFPEPVLRVSKSLWVKRFLEVRGDYYTALTTDEDDIIRTIMWE